MVLGFHRADSLATGRMGAGLRGMGWGGPLCHFVCIWLLLVGLLHGLSICVVEVAVQWMDDNKCYRLFMISPRSQC